VEVVKEEVETVVDDVVESEVTVEMIEDTADGAKEEIGEITEEDTIL
jgi:hypothetical protein